MLLQTNSYLVPRDRLAAHDALLARLRACMERLGVAGGAFEVYRQIGDEFRDEGSSPAVRCVMMTRFDDAEHHARVRSAEEADDQARTLIGELCDLVDLHAQQRTGHFGGGYYVSATPAAAAVDEAELVEAEDEEATTW